jgi:hypothetical protein
VRSSLSKAQTALGFCSGVKVTRNRLAASVMTEIELVRLYAAVSSTAVTAIAARRSRVDFMWSSPGEDYLIAPEFPNGTWRAKMAGN